MSLSGKKLRGLLGTLGISAACIALFAGCSSRKTPPESSPVAQLIRESGKNPDVAVPVLQPTLTSYTLNSTVYGKELRVNSFDYPVRLNPSVEKWLAYFQGKGRKYFEKYLERGHYFIPEISKVLKANKMPQDLVYLAMIESGFNNSAKSRAKAVGPWQFIRPTGMRYGLRVDYWMDDRRDTRKSTTAAIQYLRELFEEFGSWELAAAGYNAGENKVRRAIAKYRTNDFWEISRHRFFKRETRDYVPKIIAAAILSKNATLFGFYDPFKKAPNLSNRSTEVADVAPKDLGEGPIKEEEVAEDPVEKEQLKALAKTGKSDEDSNDDDEEDDALAPTIAGGEDAATYTDKPNPTFSPSLYMVANPNEQIVEFDLKGPADLFAISKASGLPYSTVKLLNPELLRWLTPPDLKSYPVKLPMSVKQKFLTTYNDTNFDRRVVFTKYTVKRGDSVQRLAKRFRTEAEPIREINGLGKNQSGLASGSSILLPIPLGYKRVLSSLYDDKPMTGGRRKHRVRRSKREFSSVRHRRHHRVAPKFGQN